MYALMLRISRWMAWLGGLMLAVLILLTCVSIAGRELNSALHSDLAQSVAPGLAEWLLSLGIGAVNGDFELIEAGVAFSIFAFLPLCHLTGGHASVDIFTARLPARANRWLTAVIGVVFAAVMVLIAVQLYEGMLSKLRSGQTTFLLQFPVWWAYALSLVGAVWAAVVALYLGVIRLLEALRGAPLIPEGEGAEH